MRAASIITVAAALLLVPSRSFALWEIAPVSREQAKEMNLEVRSTGAGANRVLVELEFKAEGKLEHFSRVDLRLGKGDNPPLTVSLREDRSKPPRVAFNFTADRAHLDQITLWVMVPGVLGGTIYELHPKDFVALGKGD